MCIRDSTKAENAWKKVEETREQKLAEAKELYQIADDSMCIKLVVTNADKMGTKYYVDADSVKEMCIRDSHRGGHIQRKEAPLRPSSGNP